MPAIGINGLGRIGRAALKVLLDDGAVPVAAVNDIVDAENLAYPLNHDTVYGRYHRRVTADGAALVVDDIRIPVLSERDPSRLPWGDLGADLVLECTGVFTRREDLAHHLTAGGTTVILSAPSGSDDVPTVVHGVNQPMGQPRIISCASCTTNCITPVIEVAQRRIGVARALMTTVHAYTAGQQLVDRPSRNFLRGRAAAANLVPTSTGAAQATTRAVPELAGRFDGIAVRAPIPVGSIADIVLVADRVTTAAEVNDVYRQEASTDRYRDILAVSEDPLVSSDIVGDSRAAVVDLHLTRVVDGTLVKIMAWYDNEWGFTHQLLREARRILGVPARVQAASVSFMAQCPAPRCRRQATTTTERRRPRAYPSSRRGGTVGEGTSHTRVGHLGPSPRRDHTRVAGVRQRQRPTVGVPADPPHDVVEDERFTPCSRNRGSLSTEPASD